MKVGDGLQTVPRQHTTTKTTVSEGTPMQVEEFLEGSARRFHDKTALVCDGQRWTYRQLDERANALAHAMIDAGVRRGDRGAVYLDNSSEAVPSVFGVRRAGGVCLRFTPG